MCELTVHKRIQSFTRRQGRITSGQKFALQNFQQKFCLDPNSTIDFQQAFNRCAPLIVEIGFGNGDSLATMAEQNPHLDFIGIEIHQAGIGHLILQLERRGIYNVRIFQYDAVEILQKQIADGSLTGIQLFFPDPWQKRRHHKRRLINSSFIELITRKLKPKGYFHAATDWEEYAKYMLLHLSNASGLKNISPDGQFYPRPDFRPVTKFETRGLKLGHKVWDLIFEKI